jgi:ribosomal protein S18 acetylase RimI-like enzyme
MRLMNEPFTFRPMRPGEETRVSELVTRVFNSFIAPDFAPEGVQEFLNYVQPDVLLERAQANHFALVATLGEQIVGVVEIRDYQHISLFFVDGAYLGRGIGKELWRRALEICRQRKPGVLNISVNSSPYAVPIYEKLGFCQTAPERVVNGIRFVPMALELTR